MTLLVCRAIYHNILEFHARVLDGTGCGGGLVPRPISRLTSFTPHTSPNPACPTILARCMNRAFAMHAARMHVQFLVPRTAAATDLPQHFTAMNAREIRRAVSHNILDFSARVLATVGAERPTGL